MNDSDPFDALRERMETLQHEAIALARQQIRAHLRALETRYHRHRFAFIDSMGATFISVTPGLWDHFGRKTDSTILSHLNEPNAPDWALAMLDEMHERNEACEKIAEIIGDEFNVSFGDVTTTNEEED